MLLGNAFVETSNSPYLIALLIHLCLLVGEKELD